MTDRELLELAAKAAGLTLYEHVPGLIVTGSPETKDVDYERWNPLDNDGDALRLAVKLDMQITPPAHKSRGVWAIWDKHHRHPDPCAEARRAIVRAAAEIGRAMP